MQPSVWMAPNDTTGRDPFKTAVDTQGVLTHGHLHENDNHGGEPDPKNYENMMNPKLTRLGVGLLEVNNELYLTNDFSE